MVVIDAGISPELLTERMIAVAEKRKRNKTKRTLTRTQEVLYTRDFKMADHAAGYMDSTKLR